jgi:hypothetical protein
MELPTAAHPQAPPEQAPEAPEALEIPAGRLRERHIASVNLQPGMVLARPVQISARGVLYLNLGAGSMLTEDGISQLLAHHSECVCILENDTRPVEEYEAEVAALLERLAHIFRGADDGAATQALRAALEAYRRQ